MPEPEDAIAGYWFECDRDDAEHLLSPPSEAGSWVFNTEMKDWCKITGINPYIHVSRFKTLFHFANPIDMSIFRLAHNV